MSATFSDKDQFCGACGTTLDISSGKLSRRLYHWQQYYRAVIVDQEKNSPREVFQLSGIGRFNFHHGFKKVKQLIVPLDKDQAVRKACEAGYPGHKTSEVTKIPGAAWWSSENTHRYPHGYPFHAKCWSLVERYVLKKDSQPDLERLIIAIRKQWFTCSYGIDFFLPIEEISRPWIPSCILGTEEARTGYWPFQGDPLIIPEVTKLVKEEVRNHFRKKLRSFSKKSVLLSPGKALHLPIDIQLWILDYLTFPDMRKYEKATGWSIPESYWRQRAKSLIFELEEIPETIPLDWGAICVQEETLLKTSYGLQNRKRIKWVLDGVRSIFSEIDKSDPNRMGLKDFVEHTYPHFTRYIKCCDNFDKWEERVEKLPFPYHSVGSVDAEYSHYREINWDYHTSDDERTGE